MAGGPAGRLCGGLSMVSAAIDRRQLVSWLMADGEWLIAREIRLGYPPFAIRHPPIPFSSERFVAELLSGGLFLMRIIRV